MKTNLPQNIFTEEQAKILLSELYENGESFHTEDNAHKIEWECEFPPNKNECDQLNFLMDQIFELREFDANQYLLNLRNTVVSAPVVSVGQSIRLLTDSVERGVKGEVYEVLRISYMNQNDLPPSPLGKGEIYLYLRGNVYGAFGIIAIGRINYILTKEDFEIVLR